jgi:hypothetical protein
MPVTGPADSTAMPRILAIAFSAFLLVAGLASPASADITGFLATSSTPAKHSGAGFAIGGGLAIVGFEFEYCRLVEDEVNAIPGLRTGMGNLLLQSPTKGFQVYGTVGGGMFSESYRGTSVTSFGSNIGGGAKIPLVGPVRLRLDYRIYNLHGSPLYTTPKRFYAGVSVSF